MQAKQGSKPGTLIKSKKFSSRVQLLNDETLQQLSTGYKHSVGDFDYYFQSTWSPTFKNSKVVNSTYGIPKTKKPKVSKKTKPRMIVRSQDLEVFMMCVQDACKNEPVKSSKFLQRSVKNSLFCALSECECIKQYIQKPDPIVVPNDVNAQVSSELVTTPTVGVCDDSLDNLRIRDSEKFDDIWQQLTGDIPREGMCNRDLLLREGIESNPGPGPCASFLHIPYRYGEDFILKWKLDLYCDSRALTSHVEGGYFHGTRIFQFGLSCGSRFDKSKFQKFSDELQLIWSSSPPCEIASVVRSLLARHGIETNPGPECNGNTKRKDDKKQDKKKTETMRLKRISNRDDKVGENAQRKLESDRKKKRQEAAHNANMKVLFPQLESQFSFSTNVNFSEEISLMDEVQRVIDCLPAEMRNVVSWVDICVAIPVLVSNNTWSAKYLAFRTLCTKLGVVSGDIKKLLSSLCSTLEACNISTHGAPKFQLESLEDTNPLFVFIGVILSILGIKNSQTPIIKTICKSLGDLPRATLGLDVLFKALQKTLVYCKLCYSPENSMESQIESLVKQTTHWLTREGENEYMMSPDGYGKITTALCLADEIFTVVPKSHKLQAPLSNVRFHLRSMHKKVSLSPNSGHSFRKEPVVIHLTGAAGAGKTLMVNAIAADSLQFLFNLEGVDIQEQERRLRNFYQYVYWRPVGHAYETNYNTAFSRIYIVDDANQVAHKVTPGDIPFPARLIHVANNGDFLLPVAEIENKRNAKFNSDLIIATDNVTDPDLSFLSDSDAYYRRLTLRVELSLKEEFSTVVNGVRVIDSEKTDRTVYDTRPFEFNLKGSDEKFGYEELIVKVKKCLQLKYDNFHSNRTNLVSHALRHLNIPLVNLNDNQPILDGGVKYNCAEEEVLLPLPVVEEKTPVLEKRSLNETNDNVQELWIEDDDDTVYVHINDDSLAKQLLFYLAGIYMSCGLVVFGSSSHCKKLFANLKTNLIRYKDYCLLWICYGYVRFLNKKRISNKNKIALLLGGSLLLCSSYVLYRRFSKQKNKNKTQNYGSGDASKSKPKATTKPKGKVRAVRDRESEVLVTKFDAQEFANTVNNQIESCRDNQAVDLMKKATSNMYTITVVDSKNAFRLMGVFIKGRVFMCNAHLFKGIDKENAVVTLENCFNVYKNIAVKDVVIWNMTYDNVDVPHDVMFLEFGTTVKSHYDLSSHLIPQSRLNDLKNVNVVVFSLVSVDVEKRKQWIIQQQHTHILDYYDDDVCLSSSGLSVTGSWNTLIYRAQTNFGYCGSLVIINDPKFPQKICGLHMSSLRSSDQCSAVAVVREYFDAVDGQLDIKSKISTTECYKEFKNGFSTVIDNSFDKVCTLPTNLHSYSKSSIRKSILHGQISEPEKKPAHLGMVSIEGEKFHVLQKAMNKYKGVSISMNAFRRDLFKSALHVFFTPKSTPEYLSHEEAIRGNPEYKYRRSLNRAASAGWPLCVKREPGKPGKTTFLGTGEDFVYDHPELLALIAAYIACAKLFIRQMCVFIITAKDELRTNDRVDIGKTRGFGASPLHFMILFRRHYLAIFSDMMDNRVTNSSLVGVNPYGDDWDRAAQHLSRFCGFRLPNFLAGDFRNFDGLLNRDFMWVIFDFLEEQCGRKDDPVALALWTDITQSYQVFGNTVIEVTRGQPSGNPGTTYINTMYNAGIMFVVFHEILAEINTSESKAIMSNLTEHYRALYYGDDNCFGFSSEFCSVVDPSLITKKLLEFGHEYTSDDKTDSILRYKYLSDISILKRKFVHDPDLRCWVAPLELSSILEPLNWDKVDVHNTEEKKYQMSVNARTAIRELSFHTESVYNQYKEKILLACKNNAISLDSQCFLQHASLRKLIKFEADENVEWRNFYFGSHDEQPSSIDPCVNECEISLPYTQFVYEDTQSLRTTNTNENETHDTVGDIPFKSDSDVVQTGQQIITFETVESPAVETVIAQESVPDNILAITHEGRDHSVMDVLCREYVVDTFVIPVGGVPGAIIKQWDPMNLILSQPNVQDKVSGFAFFRPEFTLRLEMSTVPTNSGGVMLSFFPDIAPLALGNRLGSLLQLSQVPNVQESLTSATSMSIDVPFISPFLARDMQSGAGRNGTIIFSRLCASGPEEVKVTTYLSVKNNKCDLSYPTPIPPSLPVSSLKARVMQYMKRIGKADDVSSVEKILGSIGETQSLRRKATEADDLKTGVISGILDKGSRVAQIAKGIPIIGSKAAMVAPLLNAGKGLAAIFGLSKPPSDVPVRAVKWKPADGHLTSEGVLPSHQFTINNGCSVSSAENPFGSKADEMAVELVMNTPNIIRSQALNLNSAQDTILTVLPLNLLHYETTGTANQIRMNHQMWLALTCNQFNADLEFNFSFFLTHFHRVKLRFSVLPGTYLSQSAVGTILSFDKDMASSEVVEFTGAHTNHNILISKRSHTPMKMIPHGSEATGVHTLSVLDANRNTIATSYGTLVVSIEVPLVVTSDTVVPRVPFITSFCARNVELSNVADGLSWLPVTQMETNLNTDFHVVPRSTKAIHPEPLESNSAPMKSEDNLSVCAGDRLMSVKQLLNAFTVFAPAQILAVGAALRVRPFVRRALSDVAAPALQSIDHFDYLIKGYAFFKGSMNMRLAISNPAFQGVVGNLGKLNAWNQQAVASTPIAGVAIQLNGTPNTSTRCIPIHSGEGVVDANCPFYQPLHMTRSLQNGNTAAYGEAYENGLIYGATTLQTVNLFRAVGDDFRMGFLMALPVFSARQALGWIP